MRTIVAQGRDALLLNLFIPFSDKVMGTCISDRLRQIKRMHAWSPEQVAKWQNECLRSFVEHAYQHTVYYRNLFDNNNISPKDIQCAEDLNRIPIIDKYIVNEHYDELVPDNLSCFRHRKGRTGGTTGQPMNYLCDEDTWGYVTAAKIYYWRTTGYSYGDAFVALGSSSLFGRKPSLVRRIYDCVRNEHPLNSVDMNDEKCARYASYIRRHHIRYLYGYAASLYIFTKYVSEHNIDLKQVKAVFTTSENLPDNYRSLIEETFQCKVMDCYGARDAGITAYETERHRYEVGYNVIAEVTDLIGVNTGTLLSTNFFNYSFPLLRYSFGDVAELEPNICPDEYNGQIIRRVIGRTSDVITLENGHSLSATGISMLMREFDVAAFDIKKTALMEVTLRVQPREGFTGEEEEKLKEELSRYVGGDCKVVVSRVAGFESLPNGKHRYFYT